MSSPDILPPTFILVASALTILTPGPEPFTLVRAPACSLLAGPVSAP